MPLHGARASALLAWVNSTNVCPDALHDLSQLQDCKVFIRIINKIHRSEEEEATLEQQQLPERISFICSFLQKHCKHKVAAEDLVAPQRLLEGEELELAKVAVLLLYHTSMSCKNPGDWNEFDYKTQVELAAILRFVLDNEENLNENLETFLQKKASLPSSSSSSSSSEEHSPLLSHPQKREVRFLELQRIASSSGTNNVFPGPPSSPMGDIMQTPQFQMRRLKKQLAAERENREELEVELAEHRKLITEKEAQMTMMQQKIERLALLNERQAADQLEPKEMEELREKNESLMVRLHEAIRQCQDLKTEKGQMDRKIDQLSEENGDLSFKLREIGSHMVQLQEALNELSEEHNAALAQAQEKQSQLESELRVALQDKQCSEEKIEILQGKISLLEDQLAKLGDSSTQEKGEVMGDVLKMEELKQEVSNLTAHGAQLQATILQLEEEKQLREAALQADRARFEEEKQQLGGLLSGLQSSLSESHQAREKLEQDLQAQEAKAKARSEEDAGRLAALNAQHEKALRERDSALQQLQHLQEANISLGNQLQALAQARDAAAAEKAELSRKVGELEASASELREVEGRLKETQQKLVEKEKLAKENGRLQERLVFLEESLRNTEGILEDEKRRAAESLESSSAKIAELEAERQRLLQAPQQQAQEAGKQLQAEQEKVARLEALLAERRQELAASQADSAAAWARAKEKEGEEQKLKGELCSLREKLLAVEQAAAQRVAGLQEELEQKLREQQEARAGLERAAAEAARAERAEAEASRREVTLLKEKALELQKLLEASRSVQSLHEGTVEALRKELQEKDRELLQSRASAEKELGALRSDAQERLRLEENLKEQLAQCLQELERKGALVSSLEHEASAARRQAAEKEGESKELKRLALAEAEKSKKVEERLRVLQAEMATAASRAAERCSLMKVEVQRQQEELDKQRLTIEALKRDRHCQGEREEELRQEAKACQEKYLQKEQLLAGLQQELGAAKAAAGELEALKRLCQELRAERAALEGQHRQELEQRAKGLAALQAELARVKLEAAEVASLRERSAEQDRALQGLQAELLGLQQTNARLLEEGSRGQQKLEAELGQALERHKKEVERLKVALEEAEEARRKLEEARKEQEGGRAAVLEEKKRLQEERQKLVAQVEQLTVTKQDQAKQVEELQKKLSQQEKASRTQQQRVKALEGELQAEASRQQQKVEELQALLAQKEQAAEHYKGQMEKAKAHYDAKKQQNQELAAKLQGMEELQKENLELKSETQRLDKELQQSLLQAKDLSSQVHSLEAQVELANRQLQELNQVQLPREVLKSFDSFQQDPAQLSSDSLELSLSQDPALTSPSRKGRRSRSVTSPLTPKTPRRLPRKVESLESLYFTPIPSRTRSQLDTTAGDSLADLSLESGCKTRSGRRRTTIDITMIKKQPKKEEAESSKASTLPAAGAKPRLHSSTRSLNTFPSQESLTMETSSPQEPSGSSALLGLPGYRPVTRSSLRHLQAGGSSSSLGRSSLFLGSCQDEPEQLEDWSRIAELQQRNRACPPHLKTCYPLESRPSNSLGTITDEDVKLGDPLETLRRASIQPSQLGPALSTRHSTLATTWAAAAGPGGPAGAGGPALAAGITTRQQRKRLSNESHQGPETPEAKKASSCFPRPQTPRERRRSQQQTPSKQAARRQSLAFSILNTPKKLGGSLLRRATRARNPTRSSTRGTPSRGTSARGSSPRARRSSPRASAPSRSPRAKAGCRSLKDTKV
ncbi:LOW QUALITY PROTEIN: nuclear mitotic apparatus protein 1-like [Melanerpes formicivorus]|uniref:LOW QUALITY PROTEIN: nuclear mitotic apparatus protein 1-like n=1 Tax=Melanerpes formicivorus TaxID=211600 RepID=UPI0035901DC6